MDEDLKELGLVLRGLSAPEELGLGPERSRVEWVPG